MKQKKNSHLSCLVVANVLLAAFSDKASRISKPKAPGMSEWYQADSSKAKKQLGIEFIPFERCVRDTATRLWEIEAELKGTA